MISQLIDLWLGRYRFMRLTFNFQLEYMWIFSFAISASARIVSLIWLCYVFDCDLRFVFVQSVPISRQNVSRTSPCYLWLRTIMPKENSYLQSSLTHISALSPIRKIFKTIKLKINTVHVYESTSFRQKLHFTISDVLVFSKISMQEIMTVTTTKDTIMTNRKNANIIQNNPIVVSIYIVYSLSWEDAPERYLLPN